MKHCAFTLMVCALPALLLAACAPAAPGTAAGPPSPRDSIISLTFDDGDADNFPSAAVLRQYGLRATWYIPSGLVGKPGYMTWDQLQALQADGHEIGGHSVDHINIDGLDAQALRHQVCDDRDALQGRGFEPVSFAYPFGGYDQAAVQMVRECGYASGRSIGAGREDIPPMDAFTLRAYPYIVSDTSFSKLQRYVSGMRKDGGGWMILIFHHVCDACDYFAVRPDVLHRFIPWLAEQQAQGRIKVRTVGEIVLEGIR
ncbi:MAG: polysaccharide deacetylase family protein [Chloroflexota bacterium]